MLGMTLVGGLGLLICAAVGPQDLNGALEQLGSAVAAERFEAERWLTAELGDLGGARLVGALEEAGDLDQEAVWRLGRALGSRPENLGLSLDLMVGRLVPGTPGGWALGKRIGSLALEQEIAGWRSGLERLPLSGAALVPALAQERERHPWRPLSVPDGSVASVVSDLARKGDLPVPIVLAQGLAAKLNFERFGGEVIVREQPFEGPWDRVLLDFARAHDLAWEAVLYEGAADDEIAWLRLTLRGEQGLESGAVQLSRALGDLARWSGDRIEGEHAEAAVSESELQTAARFLSGVEWDAALAWLGFLLESEQHHMARTAVLEAASRGRVEARLATADSVERLLEWALGVADYPRASAMHLERLAAALEQLPRIGSDGSDLGKALATGWRSEAGDGSQVIRVVRLRGLLAMQDGRPAARELARVVLAERGGLGGFIALGVLALESGAGEPVPVIGNPMGLLGLVPERAGEDELALRLARVGLSLPFDADGVASERPAALRVHLMTRVFSSDLEGAARLLIGSSERGGFGLGESGSWARTLEPGWRGRQFQVAVAVFSDLVKAGELLSARAVFGIASDLAVARLNAESAGADLSMKLATELAGLARLELLSGAMIPSDMGLLLDDLDRRKDASPIAADAMALGVLGASALPRALATRQLLTTHFARALANRDVRPGPQLCLLAIERSLEALWARSADGEAESLILEVASIAAGATSHPVAQKVLRSTWPPAPQ